MGQALRNPKYFTVDEYLALEKSKGERHEFVNGVIFAMVGGTDRHNRIVQDILIALDRLLPTTCEVFAHAMKVRVKTDLGEARFYPDVFVSCDTSDNDPLVREKPCAIFEVLSPSTEGDDRVGKFENYRRIESLETYVLVAPDVPQVEVFHRKNAWRPEILFRGDAFEICNGKAKLTVEDIYRKTAF